MTSREQFEAFLQDKYGYQPSYIADKRESYGYNRSLFQGLWIGWKASRAAVEIELPSLKQIDSGERYVWSDGVFNFKEDAIKAIRAAGIKVKGE